MKFSKSFSFAFLALLVAGCDVPRRPLPPEVQLSGISLRAPQANQCACSFIPGVSAAYLVNFTDRSVDSTVNIASYFRGSGNYIDSRTELRRLPPRSSQFLYCTITLDQGAAAAPTDAQCNIRNEFRRQSEVYSDRGIVATGLAPMDEGASRGPEFCQRECKAGTPNCQPLSADYGTLTGPIRTLVEQADASNGSVSKQDLLKAYGLSEEDDPCGRGGVTTNAKQVVNKGPSECSIRSVNAAGLFSRGISLEARFSVLNSSPDIYLRIPQTVTMTKAPRDLFAEGGRTLGIFEDLNDAFFIGFKEPLVSFAGKAEIDDQNNRFAGYLRDASEVVYGPSNRRAIVLSTSRGCLMFDAPRN